MSFSSFRKSFPYRMISLCLMVTFIATMVITPKASYAQGEVMGLPSPGSMVNLSTSYAPVLIKGLKVHPENPVLFDFIVDPGNTGLKADSVQLRSESERLIKYFLASLTIPEQDLWVNLSPYEKDRIITGQLGQTEMGRDMLAQDYMLKQLTASLIYPEKALGRTFWDKVYSRAQQLYGTSDIPVNTFNKVWIVADKAKVYVHDNTAFVVGSHLKVMLEEDYLSLEKHNGIMLGNPQGGVRMPSSKESKLNQNNTHSIGSQIVREIVLPELEKDVNLGKNFANLRQIFYSMILSAWYKKNLKEALLNQVYSNKAKINGVDAQDKTIKEKIYQEYLKAYKKGVFNYIKEDTQSDGQVIPRKYFSGGLKINVAGVEEVVSENTDSDVRTTLEHLSNAMVSVSAETAPQNAAMKSLADEVEQAWDATTVKDFIRLIHNDYFVDSQRRLEALSPFLQRSDPHFTTSILEPERLTSEWSRERLLNAQDQEYETDIFYTRSANSSARGVPKGGLRALLNHLENNSEAGNPRTASDLMWDPSFRKAFNKLNDLLKASPNSPNIKANQVRAFLQKWIEEEAKTLSMWMSFKTSVIGLALGGGKGVFFVGNIRENKEDGTFSIEDSELWRDKDEERKYINVAKIARQYVQILYESKRVGPDIDVPAPDKRTDGVSMGYATDEYIRLNMDVIKNRDLDLYKRLLRIYHREVKQNNGNYPVTSTALVETANRYLHTQRKPVPELAVFTGKKIEHGGVKARTEATGYGVYSMIEGLIESLGERIEGKTLAVQGTGNVGLYLALMAAHKGMKVQILSDEGATLIKNKGFTEAEIQKFIDQFERNKKKMYQIWQEVVENVNEIKFVEGTAKERSDAVLNAHVDVLSPCATEGVITGENAPNIEARMIVPGANGPITPAALENLIARGIYVVSDTLANARGVMVSYFEQVQALTGHIFTADEVTLIGSQIHKQAFADVWAEAKKRRISLTQAADIVAAQGIIRAQYLVLINKYKGDLKKISNERKLGETEAKLSRQIAASGLSSYLNQVQTNTLKINVVTTNNRKKRMGVLTEANYAIPDFSSPQVEAPFSMSPLLWISRDIHGDISIKMLKTPQEVASSAAQASDKAEIVRRQGGINLNSENMHMVVGGEKINIKFDPAMMKNFRRGDFSGVMPIIIRITPIANPWPILGLNPPQQESLAKL